MNPPMGVMEKKFDLPVQTREMDGIREEAP